MKYNKRTANQNTGRPCAKHTHQNKIIEAKATYVEEHDRRLRCGCRLKQVRQAVRHPGSAESVEEEQKDRRSQ